MITLYINSTLLVLARPRCRGVDLGLRPLEPSGDFLIERARFFGGDIITHICVMTLTGSDVLSALTWGGIEHLVF